MARRDERENPVGKTRMDGFVSPHPGESTDPLSVKHSLEKPERSWEVSSLFVSK